ncbi:hypothetical protein RhiJN_13011 [Ceratobasidium sp. AG-Ba]|nr:hypothetical protein RhiJN_13011 [Ceratobasidium sp. AG-Ba]
MKLHLFLLFAVPCFTRAFLTLGVMQLKTTIELPTQFKEGALARLRVYAPFVRVLDVWNNSLELFCTKQSTLLNWRELYTYSRTQPLLPNVRQINISPYGVQHSNPTPVWMTLCLGPSLEIFETNSRIGKLDWGTQLGEKFYTSKWMNRLLLAAIGNACPNLRVLTLFHGTLQPRHQFDYLCKEIMKHYYGGAEPLDGSFKSLAALTVSDEILTLLPHETSSSFDLLQFRLRMNPIKIGFLNVDEIVAYNLYPSLKHLVIHLEGNMIEYFYPLRLLGSLR